MIENKLVLIFPKIHPFHLQNCGFFSPSVQNKKSKLPWKTHDNSVSGPYAEVSLLGQVFALCDAETSGTCPEFWQGVSLASHLYLAASPFTLSPCSIFQSPEVPTEGFLNNPRSLRCGCQFIKLWWRREALREVGRDLLWHSRVKFK